MTPLTIKHLAAKASFASIVIAGVLMSASSAYAADSDRDGLPDEWELAGRYGSIDLRGNGVRVGRPDVILFVGREPGLAADTPREQLARLKRFFSEVPTRNSDGSSGINLVIIDRGEMPRDIGGLPYTDPRTREWTIPLEWRGYAHGYFLANGTGGGGSSPVCSDWGGSGYGWQLVAHELGHQLGLGHEAFGDSKPSPLYASLMNYLYSYSFAGSPEAVRFSPGEFVSFPLDETNLNENLPFSIDRLRFLEPYFRIRSAGPMQTHVDWNRNGIFGETGVRASITDGYAVPLGPYKYLDPTSGSPSLTAIGSNIFLVYPVASGDPLRFSTPFETRRGGVALKLRQFINPRLSSTEDGILPEQTLLRSGASGNPTAQGFGNRLAVAFPGSGGSVALMMWRTSPAGIVGRPSPIFIPSLTGYASQVSLAVSGPRSWLPDGVSPGLPSPPNRLWLFAWSPADGGIRVVEISDTSGEMSSSTPRPRSGDAAHQVTYPPSAGGGVVTSASPIGVAFNRTTQKMILVTKTRIGTSDHRLQINELSLRDGRWVSEPARTVGLSENFDYESDSAPSLFVDDSPSGGLTGKITIVARRTRSDGASNINRYMEINDRTVAGGWRASLMGNEWNYSYSSPAIIRFGDNNFYAFRWYEPETPSEHNRIIVHRMADGISDGTLHDQDDVRYLSETGIRSCPRRPSDP
jgi:hypothetical protein